MLDPLEARARLAAARPAAYAATHNHLGGADTGLSPCLTHGLLGLADVVEHLALPRQHMLIQELGWRALFQHRWRLEGERYFESLHPGPLPDAAYANAVTGLGQPAPLAHRCAAPRAPAAARAVDRTGECQGSVSAYWRAVLAILRP
jgi:deoxyribodipyrimidine photo-lyase